MQLCNHVLFAYDYGSNLLPGIRVPQALAEARLAEARAEAAEAAKIELTLALARADDAEARAAAAAATGAGPGHGLLAPSVSTLGHGAILRSASGEGRQL